MENEKTPPLAGIKVIELATAVAAPAAGRMLCAYGAEVVKVENPIGDDLRRAGEAERVPCGDYKNPIFTIENSGKKLAALNLKTEAGRAAMLRLLAGADVFLTNVRAAALSRLGLDYGTLSAAFPGLVYARFSAYGQSGPSAAEPGFDSTAFWLRSGPMADWQAPGAFPFSPTYAFGDMATSSVLLSGILMALLARARTGKGTLVDTSLYASGIWCNAVGVVSRQPQFGGERRPDPLRPADPLSHYYLCADGRWIGVFDNDYGRERGKFARLFGLPELLDDPRCASLEALARTDAVVEVVEKLNRLFLTRPSAEWRAWLMENSVSCEVMRSAREVSSDEQALANGYVEELEFADGLKVMMPCPPLRFSEYSRRPSAPCGAIGEDTDEVLRALGYSESEIAQMRANGAAK